MWIMIQKSIQIIKTNWILVKIQTTTVLLYKEVVVLDMLDVSMQLIGNVGFPIFVSIYLMTRTEKKLDDLIAAVEKLAQ